MSGRGAAASAVMMLESGRRRGTTRRARRRRGARRPSPRCTERRSAGGPRGRVGAPPRPGSQYVARAAGAVRAELGPGCRAAACATPSMRSRTPAGASSTGSRRRCRAGRSSSSGPTAATIAFSSEANSDAVAAAHDVQRLDAELVAGQRQRRLSLVVDREREHAAEPRQARRAPRRQASSTTSVSDSVRKRTPAALELGPQLAVVVDLAVVDRGSARPSTKGWSAAVDRSMIDSRRCARCDGGVGVARSRARRTRRPAVPEPVDHRVDDDLAVRLLVCAGDAAHRSALVARRLAVADGDRCRARRQLDVRPTGRRTRT